MMNRIILTVAATLVAAGVSAAAKVAPFKDGDSVVFLGDSITHGGRYVADLQAFWSLRYPGSNVRMHNCGISGQRANHGVDRFDWDVAPLKPNRIFILFGMNDVARDARWTPPYDEKKLQQQTSLLATYVTNMTALVAKCRAIGVEPTIITPTPYDEYGTKQKAKPAVGTNEPGLLRFAAAARELAARERLELVEFFDVLTPILKENEIAEFLKDRVHPGKEGHLLMANCVIRAMGIDDAVGEVTFDAAGGARSFTYAPKRLPYPVVGEYAKMDCLGRFTDTWNREIVRIKNLPKGVYNLYLGGKIYAAYSSDELAAGVNVTRPLGSAYGSRLSPSGIRSNAAYDLLEDFHKSQSSLRVLAQTFVQVRHRGGDVTSLESCLEKYNQWMDEYRSQEWSRKYADYYGKQIPKFTKKFQNREADERHLEDVRAKIAAFRPAPYEIRIEAVEPPKDLPDLATKGREELKAVFEANVFGKRTVERPPVQRFEQVAPDETIYGGLGIKRRMKAVFGNGTGDEMEMPFVAYVPAKPGKHPAFVMVAPNPETIAEPVSVGRPHRMPVKELLERGYAGVPYYNHACAFDLKNGFPMTNGVWRVFGPTGAKRTADSWGAISAWAWGASRVMDWVETQPEFDASRVAVVGLSRNGKTALWAGATDERFALTISCCSGCGGAKLNRANLPASEHVKDLKRNFPHWFANSFYAWAEREETAPFDMHGIVAMCAPRNVIITSASEDAWAGQYGEYLSGKLASPAWERVGRKGLVGEYPMPAVPLQEGLVAYHRRIGPHGQESYDWQRYMDFFDKIGTAKRVVP